MKNIALLLMLLPLSFASTAYAQVGGNYSAARPVDCRTSDTQNVHHMRVFLIEDNNEEFVVHLTSKVGACVNDRFAALPLTYDYETTFIPERFFFKESFDAGFRYDHGAREGVVTMRFEKKRLFRKHHLQKMDFYFGVHGKGHHPLYFKWYISVMQLPDGKVKFSTSYQGSRSQI